MKKQEQNLGQTNPFSEMEEEVLGFWEKGKIFEKSVETPPIPPLIKGGDSQTPLLYKEGLGEINQKFPDYVFYDGPPFATGTPHYGHIVASVMKDVVPRYWTMQGYRVERRWGWDCHGLPIENIVEKEMGSKSKKDIEKIGVAKFNEMCRSKVLGYVEEWKKVIKRLGRWADMENAYKTMDLDFMESVWWVFKELYARGLIYEGYRSMLICPRCETTLSQQEVAEGYKTIKDLSAVVKFELESKGSESLLEALGTFIGKTYILAWTTTPWTLIGNVALAVGEDINYVAIREKGTLAVKPLNHTYQTPFSENEIYIVAKNIFTKEDRKLVPGDSLNKAYFFHGKICEIIDEFKGKKLVGLKYKPLFDYYIKDERLENRENGWKIYPADFVTTEEGTGAVHIAPAFGEDDLNLGKKENLPFLQHVGMDGVIKKEAGEFAGMNVKPKSLPDDDVSPEEGHMTTDIEIIKYLARHNLLFAKGKYEHSYPHCWRCETPLINYATSSWFVNILKIKEKMLKLAKKINWSPAHIKEGRFGKWLEGARDWSISRQRFWASVIPIWRCAPTRTSAELNADQRGQSSCGNTKVVGSIKELEELSGEKVMDLHKHIIDKVVFPCDKCGGVMERVPDVLDTWFDSGSMPYAQMHYPFENKEKFEKNFPAEFIAEGVDQTRAWFYYLHAIAIAIKGRHAYKNVIVNGIVLAEDGKKMSKRLNNYPDPGFVFEKYGADALRYYLITSPVMFAENLNFSEKGVREALRNVVMTLWNVYKFYKLFTNGHELKTNSHESKNILDKWILARLNQLIKEMTDGMDNYNLPKAARPIADFVNDFSTWYLRRSRERFKNTPPTPPLIKGENIETPLINKEGLGEVYADKQTALETTHYVLLELSKLMAPFMPFMAEQIWQKVSGNDFKDENKSVHLEGWSVEQESKKTKKQESKILEEMEVVRKIVELGLAERDKAGIKVRQPLSELRIKNYELRMEYEDLVKDELNVKNIKFKKGSGEFLVELDTEITPELKLEGVKRELVRFINVLRKEAGMTIKDRAVVYWQSVETRLIASLRKVFEKFGTEIMADTLSDGIKEDDIKEAEFKKEVKINEDKVILGIRKKV